MDTGILNQCDLEKSQKPEELDIPGDLSSFKTLDSNRSAESDQDKDQVSGK